MVWHRPIGLFAGLSIALAGGAGAQEAGGSPRLALELNRLEQVEASCRLTFLAQNQLGHDLDQVVLEAVLVLDVFLVLGAVVPVVLPLAATLVPRSKQKNRPGSWDAYICLSILLHCPIK